MTYIFLFLVTFIIALLEPLLGLLLPGVMAFVPPLVVWIFLWLYGAFDDKRYFFILASIIGLVLDSIEQTLLGFHALLIISSINGSIWAIRSIIDKSNLKYPAIIVLTGVIYYGGEVLYHLLTGL
ncbi:hypothetical protein KC573_01650 [candidate division WWE3 bacterium]|uniref:Rod shape-determining protein MreD n=1 Tax=candidate division WWE3 bacterium TaxID=2053526 RepID=A0A955LVW7_UNCKA|nr:hypothetical protein [candidate division WWE3 bacterium]